MAVVEARHAADVDNAWLMEILRGEGYDVSPSPEDAALLLAKHSSRPNVLMKVHPELNLITVQSFWTLKKGGFGGHKDLLEKLNKANSQSWRDTFYITAEGNLGVSSYITLADQLSVADITGHLAREAEGFFMVATASGLREHLV